MSLSSSLLFQIPPDDYRIRQYLTKHVLLGLENGTYWRGTLKEWSPVRRSLKLTNAQQEGPSLTGLGLAFKSFAFVDIAEVRVADASDAVLMTLSESQRELALASAASMERAAAEDARVESHRGMTETVHEAETKGLSFTELLIQKGIAKPVNDEDDDDDENDDAQSSKSKKTRRRGGKKKKKKAGLVAVDDPELNEHIAAAADQNAAAAVSSEPSERVILEWRGGQLTAHILPASSVRGAGVVLDLLRAGVGPIVVAPPSEEGTPTLDAEFQKSSGERSTLRTIAAQVLQDRLDSHEAMRQELGLSQDAWDKVKGVFASAPPGAENLDPDLKRVLGELEAGSLGVVFHE